MVTILGQLLKNFPGSIPAERKASMTSSCYALAMRALSSFFGLMRANEEALVLDIVDLVRDRFPGIQDEDVLDKVQATLGAFAHMASFDLIRRVSYAVGSPSLMATYERVLAASPTPANELIDSAIALDNSGTFPDARIRDRARQFSNNPLALSVLRHLTVQHFYLFPVEYRIKQRVCDALGIPYARLTRAVDPKRKLLNG